MHLGACLGVPCIACLRFLHPLFSRVFFVLHLRLQCFTDALACRRPVHTCVQFLSGSLSGKCGCDSLNGGGVEDRAGFVLGSWLLRALGIYPSHCCWESSKAPALVFLGQAGRSSVRAICGCPASPGSGWSRRFRGLSYSRVSSAAQRAQLQLRPPYAFLLACA